MSIDLLDTLDPGAVKTDADMRDWMGRARSVLVELRNNEAAHSRAAADLAAKYTQIQEEQSAPRVSRDITGTESDMVARYVTAKGSDAGKVRLVGRTEVVNFAGRTFEMHVPGILDDRELCSEWQRDFQRAVGDRAVVRSMLKAGTPTPYLDEQVVRLALRAPAGIRGAIERAFSDSSAAGAEWIPDTFNPELYMSFEVPSVLEGLFETVAIQGPMIRPKITGQPRPYLISEATLDDNAKVPTTSITTSSQTLAPPTFGMRFLVSYQSAEDSALPLASIVPQYMVKGHRDGYEDCLVNGDTTATHQDTGIAAWNIRSRWGTSGLGLSTDHRRAFIGFRKLASARSATVNQSAGMTAAKIGEELMGGMAEQAAGSLVVVTSPEVLFKKLMTDSNTITVDKMGPNATIMRGAPAAIFGRPIVVSRFVDCQYNASGIYDDSTKTKSLVIVVNTGELRHYTRRGRTVELTRKADVQQIEYVTSERRGLDTLSASTDKIVSVGYGWTGVS